MDFTDIIYNWPLKTIWWILFAGGLPLLTIIFILIGLWFIDDCSPAKPKAAAFFYILGIFCAISWLSLIPIRCSVDISPHALAMKLKQKEIKERMIQTEKDMDKFIKIHMPETLVAVRNLEDTIVSINEKTRMLRETLISLGKNPIADQDHTNWSIKLNYAREQLSDINEKIKDAYIANKKYELAPNNLELKRVMETSRLKAQTTTLETERMYEQLRSLDTASIIQSDKVPLD